MKSIRKKYSPLTFYRPTTFPRAFLSGVGSVLDVAGVGRPTPDYTRYEVRGFSDDHQNLRGDFAPRVIGDLAEVKQAKQGLLGDAYARWWSRSQ